MATTRTKIVLDADVIIHFAKGELLSILPDIFPEYKFVVLDIVYNEVKQPILNQLGNQIALIKNIEKVTFSNSIEQQKEYSRLTGVVGLGRGESACMVYCRFNNDVIGSSNLKDITDYCEKYNITYLTTIDFLYYGIIKKIITKEQAEEFITKVTGKGSKLPKVDFSTYICSKI